MPIYIVEESTYAGPIPDDEILSAKLIACAEQKKPFKEDDGSDAIRLSWTFVVDDAYSVFDGQKVFGDTRTKMSTNPENKLRNWCQEMVGAELPPGTAVNTDDFVGMTCRIQVGQRKREENGQEKIRNYVKDVLRSKEKMAMAAQGYAEEPF